jgi:hypothetical protein
MTHPRNDRPNDPEQDKVVWIGLLTVTPKTGCKLLGPGNLSGCANVLAMAASEADFARQVSEACSDSGLRMVKLQESELLESRLQKWHIDPALRRLASEVEETAALRFDAFHVSPEEPPYLSSESDS